MDTITMKVRDIRERKYNFKMYIIAPFTKKMNHMTLKSILYTLCENLKFFYFVHFTRFLYQEKTKKTDYFRFTTLL